MRNLDTINEKRKGILQCMADAVKANDNEGFSAAFGELADLIQENVRGEFQEVTAQQDNAILGDRGVRVLTSGETSYYNNILNAMRSEAPQQALTNINKVLPETVIDAVFDDLRAAHPLLSAINFQNTGALVKILLSTTGGVAVWGAIAHTIASELSASFTEVDLSLAKLSAFLPVNKYMIELGPQWLDRYVREVLTEALAVQMEVGIISGNGKDKPIGMQKKLTGAVDGVYPNKTAVTINDLSPASMSGILNTLSQGPNGKRRPVAGIIMVVNPSDYFTKVFPATTPRAADGTYNHDVLPYPTTIIQSPAVTAGQAIFGIAERYFMGVGTQSGGKLEYSDEYKFLEQVRTYLIYLYGYGRAMDENAFVLCDISGLREYVLPVTVSQAEDTRLASLAIGALTLTPAFDKNIYNYAAATTNATNTVTAVAKDGEATMTIKNGSSTVNNGAAATWAEGENTVTVKVTNGDAEQTYTVTVTATES